MICSVPLPFEASDSPEQHERLRIEILEDLNILDTPESESFDRITRMAQRFFHTPVAAVSLTDRDRQWFKSSIGTEGRQIPREGAPCAEVTRRGDVLVISDLLSSEMFAECLLARNGVRFYAGAPLTTRDGYTLGAMCVLDTQPREVDQAQIDSLRDMAAMVMAQIELQHDFGRVDAVSGLPNRNQLLEDLADLGRKSPGEPRTAILIDACDPQQLRDIVNVLGAGFLDDLVRKACSAIKATVGRQQPLYLVGSASFLLVLDGTDCSRVIPQLSEALSQPIVSNGVPVTVHPALGWSSFVVGELSPTDVLRTALSAAHDARVQETWSATYSSDKDDAKRRRFRLLTDIPGALQSTNEMTLVYQPRVDLLTGVCVSAEALLRWQSPEFGAVSPGEFIPLVEQTALARPVTRWVISTVLDQVAAWTRAGLDIRVSINISARNLEETDFASALAGAMAERGIEGRQIELEFIESALIRNRARVLEELDRVRALGVELALDDFGTGYCTFSYLHKLPATTMKIDQSFIRTLAENKLDQTLVRSMISMAHDIGYRVVAEGVETGYIYEFLKSCHCDEAQGYFVARPLTVEAFEQWLADNRSEQVRDGLRALQQQFAASSDQVRS